MSLLPYGEGVFDPQRVVKSGLSPVPPAGFYHSAFTAVVCSGSSSTPLFDT